MSLPQITPQIDNTIRELVQDLDHLSNPYEKISSKINEQYATNFTSNQIRQYLKDNQIKILQNRGPPFTTEIDESIKEFMKGFGNLANPYVKISEKINKKYNTNYTSKQIRQRWISKLDTSLCLELLSDDEKLFIVQWIENKSREDKINWKELIFLMKTKFNKLRTENMVKNYWNLRKRKSIKSKVENKNSRKGKGSPKPKVKDERQQQKKGCYEFITHEYEVEKYIKSSPPDGDSNARSMKTSFKNEEKILSLPLFASPTETPFKNEANNIHLPPLNASPTETPFKNEANNIYLPPLNARPMGTPFKNEVTIHLPPMNVRSMGTSFENANIHLPPNARLMETSLRNEEIIPYFPMNARKTFKDEEKIHSLPLNATPMEISSENEENTPPLNAMEILCRVADAAYKRDFPEISTK